MPEPTPTGIPAAADAVSVAPERGRRMHGLSPLALRLVIAGAVVVAFALAILLYDNALPFGSAGFWTIVRTRGISIATIILVAVCQAVATLIFHTVTSNRILTPSILGFDSLYIVMQTALVFFFGASSLAASDGILKIITQSGLMILFASLLYGWLFSGKRADLHVLLLVGVVLGLGFRALSTFMQRMLTPSEFDILASRMFGNISNSSPDYLPLGFAVCGLALVVVWRRRFTLDVVTLGRETATGLGVNHRRELILMLVLVAVLVSIATTMIGPMTFFGFLVVTLTYQIASSHRHSELLPLSALVGAATLLGAYFVLRHVFNAGGLITVIIEFAGGLIFLVYLLRKGIR